MKQGRFLSPVFLTLTVLALFTGCAGGPRPTPTTPPTFVMAWTSDGAPPGQVWTTESNDGIVWRNPTTQNLQGNASESNAGPALAHDGNISWMLMWPNPRGLDYKTGLGGVALSGAGGVVWEQQPIQGRLPVQVTGSPTLAFGVNRWLTVFRSTGNRLRAVRSQQNSSAAWEAARDVEFQGPAGPLPAISQRDPALAFGAGTFVLVRRTATGFFASTSPDGIAWTDRGRIAQITNAEASDPVVTFANGNFFAALRKALPIPPTWSTTPPATAEVYKSPDGIAWTRIADKAGYFPVGEDIGPGFSFGDFGNNVCRAILTSRAVQVFPAGIGPARGIQSWTGTPPPPHTCNDPALVLFSPDEAAGVEVTNRGTASRTVIVFGRTLP